MSLASNPYRPLASLKQALRQCRAVRQQQHAYATSVHEKAPADYPPPAQALYPSLQPKYPLPSKGFRPSQAIKQNRINENLRRIKTFPSPRSSAKICPDPIKAVTETQLKTLDPTGARWRLFNLDNPDKINVGDVVMVRQKNGDPFSGVLIEIRKRHQPIDAAILLRNQLTRVGVEMWYKIYSPNVEGIELVQRKQGRRARRAKLTYMRKPKHDMGSVENLVRNYLRNRIGGPLGGKNAKTAAQKKGKGKRK